MSNVTTVGIDLAKNVLDSWRRWQRPGSAATHGAARSIVAIDGVVATVPDWLAPGDRCVAAALRGP